MLLQTMHPVHGTVGFSLFQTKPHGTVSGIYAYMDRVSHP